MARLPLEMLTDVLAGLDDAGVAVDVPEHAETEALGVGRGAEAVDDEGELARVEGLAHPLVELVVAHRAPERWLRVLHGEVV